MIPLVSPTICGLPTLLSLILAAAVTLTCLISYIVWKKKVED